MGTRPLNDEPPKTCQPLPPKGLRREKVHVYLMHGFAIRLLNRHWLESWGERGDDGKAVIWCICNRTHMYSPMSRTHTHTCHWQRLFDQLFSSPPSQPFQSPSSSSSFTPSLTFASSSSSSTSFALSSNQWVSPTPSFPLFDFRGLTFPPSLLANSCIGFPSQGLSFIHTYAHINGIYVCIYFFVIVGQNQTRWNGESDRGKGWGSSEQQQWQKQMGKVNN